VHRVETKIFVLAIKNVRKIKAEIFEKIQESLLSLSLLEKKGKMSATYETKRPILKKNIRMK
jgi:hypothetical protein